MALDLIRSAFTTTHDKLEIEFDRKGMIMLVVFNKWGASLRMCYVTVWVFAVGLLLPPRGVNIS